MRTAGSMTRLDAAQFLEAIAVKLRDGKVDVQSIFEGLEITSTELDGFRMQINGQVHKEIGIVPPLHEQVLRMFHKKHNHANFWVKSLISDAEYFYDNFFEYRGEDLREDAYEQYRTPEIIFQIAEGFYNGDIMYSDYMQDIVGDIMGNELQPEDWTSI